MNKRLFTLSALLLCLAVSCTSPDRLTYPDCAMYGLNGKVKAVHTIISSDGESEEYTLRFKKNGLCTTHRTDRNWQGEAVVNSVERDSCNRITIRTTMGKRDKKSKVKTRYTYNSNGNVSTTNSMWHGKTVITENYEYNADGLLTKVVRNILDDNPSTETILFRNPKFDTNKNWIEREGLKINEKSGEGEERVTKERVFTEKRKITYY